MFALSICKDKNVIFKVLFNSFSHVAYFKVHWHVLSSNTKHLSFMLPWINSEHWYSVSTLVSMMLYSFSNLSCIWLSVFSDIC